MRRQRLLARYRISETAAQGYGKKQQADHALNETGRGGIPSNSNKDEPFASCEPKEELHKAALYGTAHGRIRELSPENALC
jgi:hypothetical protein